MMSPRIRFGSLTVILLLLFGTLVHVKGSLIPANSNESGGDEEGVSSYPGPAYRGVPGTGRLARRSYYTDSAYIPYIHPRFVMEQDFPPEGEDETILPPQSKRATKGMLVDVVDFVTKGSENRGQRMGQGMRSSGRR